MFASAMSAFAGRCPALRPAAGRPARSVTRMAADRPMWYPGATPPDHLDGTMAGDYGFDPLALGANENLLPWFREAELMNGRFAMVAVPGIIMTELLGFGNFWEAGANVQSPLSLQALIGLQVVIMGALEYKRFEIFKKTGECGLLGFAPFDPMGMKSEETMVKEVKNARLGMLAFIGFCSQAAVQGKGPVACFAAHIKDPLHENIYTSKVGPEVTAAIVCLAIWPFIVEAQKALGGKDKETFRALPW
ncbi:unnamed protein product [Ostreobium quekettii]|uniref:Chlorophyll a-b binding protein, chloroplastic n=1 Tax=Ostreobium quekettii TaxID=121088 RepID=A0A8S1J712_9CHLO|nr:unnamed protein product [Ostreobium quekettii]|eukprot:evm.model.scf_1161.2 EVM.evm.TU.scf_1161.2   scf_1161:18389-19132(-)